MTDAEVVMRAERVARQAHHAQYRRDGKTPYITHPQRVAGRCQGNLKAQAVAWLHDVIEDTDVDRKFLKLQGIPEDIIQAVEVLTKPEGLGRDYTSYMLYIAKVKENESARLVKIQDILDNMTDKPTERQMYRYSQALVKLVWTGKEYYEL
jgi:(p)ppGpp synthase/HD superfamily hydrolase